MQLFGLVIIGADFSLITYEFLLGYWVWLHKLCTLQPYIAVGFFVFNSLTP